jgi:uroporphyrinogen III methyltransferase / synthase
MSGPLKDHPRGPREDIAGALSPLADRVVADTRGEGMGTDLAALLERAGAVVLRVPVMRILPPLDGEALEAAAAALHTFDWVILASANGARSLTDACGRLGVGLGVEVRPRICAVGPATRDVLVEQGWPVDLIPEHFLAEGVLASLDEQGGVRGRRVLLPRPADAPDLLPTGLRARGAHVVEVEGYRNAPHREGLESLKRAVRGDQVDIIILTAASSARRVAEVLGGDVGRARVVAIGPATAKAAEGAGLPVAGVADPHTIQGLVMACAGVLEQGRPL